MSEGWFQKYPTECRKVNFIKYPTKCRKVWASVNDYFIGAFLCAKEVAMNKNVVKIIVGVVALVVACIFAYGYCKKQKKSYAGYFEDDEELSDEEMEKWVGDLD